MSRDGEANMHVVVHLVLAISVAAAGGYATAEMAWPSFMPSLAPGVSTSPVQASMPDEVAVATPAADVPSDKARWSGRWRGWACPTRQCDTRLVVERVDADGALAHYAFASSTEPPSVTRVEAKFEQGELRGVFPSGVINRYRMRASGDIEFMWQRGSNWVVGVLSKEPPADSR